jgi:hypothetical protein
MMGDKKPKAYTFTKNAGLQFNLPDAEPMDYFVLFFNDELLKNIVTETNRYVRHKNSLVDDFLQTLVVTWIIVL